MLLLWTFFTSSDIKPTYEGVRLLTNSYVTSDEFKCSSRVWVSEIAAGRNQDGKDGRSCFTGTSPAFVRKGGGESGKTFSSKGRGGPKCKIELEEGGGYSRRPF